MGEGHGGALDFLAWELQIPYMGEEGVKNFFFFFCTCDIYICSFWFILFSLFCLIFIMYGEGTLATVHIYRSEELLCAVACLHLFWVLWIELRSLGFDNLIGSAFI